MAVLLSALTGGAYCVPGWKDCRGSRAWLWPLGPSGVNGVTFLVPQELNASRPATPKMDSARMTMFAGNRWLPRGSLCVCGGPGQGPGESWCQTGKKRCLATGLQQLPHPCRKLVGAVKGGGQPQLLSAFLEVGWLESPLQATAAKRKTQQHFPGLSRTPLSAPQLSPL